MIKKKNLYGMLFVLVIIFFMGLTAPSVYAKDMCVDCHKNEKFRIQKKVLFDYYNNWKDSTHDLAGVTCTDCHRGDATKSNKDAAHKGHFSFVGVTDKESFKKIPQICGKCHEEVLGNFVESKHYRALSEKGNGPHCVTCHGSMNVKVYYTSIIAKACDDCHNEYTKNHPEVVGEADKILHRINVSRAFRNWVTIHYSDKEPRTVKKINELYRNITNAWHTFQFVKLDEKSLDLLNQLKSLVNRGLAEKKKKQ